MYMTQALRPHTHTHAHTQLLVRALPSYFTLKQMALQMGHL